MTADEPHAAEDVMENGCEALDARIKAQNFAKPWADHCARQSGHVRRRTLCQGDPRAFCRCTVCCDLVQDGGTGRLLSQTFLPLLVARRPSISTWTLGDWRAGQDRTASSLDPRSEEWRCRRTGKKGSSRRPTIASLRRALRTTAH